MRIVHIADAHLGYRAYNRVNNAGINAREADVFASFRQALTKTAELQPDLVVIAGDLFHVVRPSNLMIQYAYQEFAKLRAKTNAPIVIIGGNHDSPRSVDTGCILDLFANIPGMHVAHGEFVQITLADLDASVYCLCHRALPSLSSLKIEPDSASKCNVLVVHGTVEGVMKQAYDAMELKKSDVLSERWDYIAFGHYHCFTELAANAYYAGSTEYTSTNIWSETATSKGFIEYDTDERKLAAFHKLDVRDVIDLRGIDATDLEVATLDKMIRQRVESIPDSHTNKIVRLVVDNIPKAVQRDLDYTFVREMRSQALHFDMQLRHPSRDRHRKSITLDSQPRTLEDEWEEFAGECELPAGLERVAFTEKGREYLGKTT